MQDISDPLSGNREEHKIIMYSEARNVTLDLRMFGDGGKRVEARIWDVRVEDTDTQVMESGIQRWVSLSLSLSLSLLLLLLLIWDVRVEDTNTQVPLLPLLLLPLLSTMLHILHTPQDTSTQAAS